MDTGRLVRRILSFFALFLILYAAVHWGSAMPEPHVSVASLEDRLASPPLDRIELGAHLAFGELTRCVVLPSHATPDHCYYPAISEQHPLARQLESLRHEMDADGDTDAAQSAVMEGNVSLVVRSNSMLVPMSWSERLRPLASGRLQQLAELPAADQDVIADMLGSKHRSVWVFEPDEQPSSLSLLYKTPGGRKLLFVFLAFLVAAVIGVMKVVRRVRGASRETTPKTESAPPVHELAAPSIPSVPPTPSTVPPSDGFAPGMRVSVRRGDSIVPATIESVRPGQCFCDFGSGRRAWVLTENIDPSTGVG